MTVTTTVEPAVIAVMLGQPTPDAGSVIDLQWRQHIDDALMLIQIRVDGLGVDEANIDELKVDYVVRHAVVAHVLNPDDATTVNTSVDDASVSKTYRSSHGRVQILDEWWTLLGLNPEGGRAFHVDTVPAGGPDHRPWCSRIWGASCSCGANLTGAAGYPLWEL